MTTPPDYSHLFIELGCVAVGLAVLARLARRFGLSAISLYLVAGLAFGNGGFLPLKLTKGFIQLGAEIGVLLLLFMLGLEYSGENLAAGLRKGASGAAIDLLLNFPPGFIAGLLLGWSPLASVLLGGITLVTSSGIVARVLTELKRMDAP
jgi:monovalent cation:H+ antiporter-2, CPA2 family